MFASRPVFNLALAAMMLCGSLFSGYHSRAPGSFCHFGFP
jgi:hypothetical protein